MWPEKTIRRHLRYRQPGWRRLALLALLASTVLLCGQTSSTAVAPLVLRAPRTIVWKDFLGVNAHLLWFDAASYHKQIAKLQALGLQWVRVDLLWDVIEPTEGNYQWSMLDPVMAQIKASGLKAEVYLVDSPPYVTSAPPGAAAPQTYPPADPQLYAKTIAKLAARYPQVMAWQVWNEPNLPAFWAPDEDPVAYNNLLNLSMSALHQAAPNAMVVNGGMAYYSQMPTLDNNLMIYAQGSEGLYSTGAAIAYHPYSNLPEGDDATSRDFIAFTQIISNQLRSSGVKQIWADEWGWSSYAGPVEAQPIIGTQGQAKYLLRRLALISALDIDRTFIFALSDLDARATVRDRSYGLVDLNVNPKPAYTALANFLKFTGPQLTPADTPAVSQPPSGLISITWTRPDGSHLWMFWASANGTAVMSNVAKATLYDPLANKQTSLVAASNGTLKVPVTANLQMLEW